MYNADTSRRTQQQQLFCVIFFSIVSFKGKTRFINLIVYAWAKQMRHHGYIEGVENKQIVLISTRTHRFVP